MTDDKMPPLPDEAFDPYSVTLDELQDAWKAYARAYAEQQTAELRSMLLDKPTGTGWARVLEMQQQTAELRRQLDAALAELRVYRDRELI